MSDRALAAITAGGGLFVAIVAGANLLRRRSRGLRIGDEAAAMACAGARLAGFRPAAAVVGTDGAAALVSGPGTGTGTGQGPGDGERLALLYVRRRRLAARDVDWSAVRATPAGIVVETGDRRVGGVALTGIDALDVRRLAPAASEEAVRTADRLGT